MMKRQGSVYDLILPTLVDIPPASREVMERAAAPSGGSPALHATLQRERDFVSRLLSDAFMPPAAAPLLPFRAENGFLDVVRCTYRVGAQTVVLADSRWVMSVVVRGSEGTDKSPLKRAEALALRVFGIPLQIRLRQTGQDGGLTFGRQDVEGGRVSSDFLNWVDALAWWCEGDAVGFVTVKTFGGPTGIVISPEPQMNQPWFPS